MSYAHWLGITGARSVRIEGKPHVTVWATVGLPSGKWDCAPATPSLLMSTLQLTLELRYTHHIQISPLTLTSNPGWSQLPTSQGGYPPSPAPLRPLSPHPTAAAGVAFKILSFCPWCRVLDWQCP